MNSTFPEPWFEVAAAGATGTAVAAGTGLIAGTVFFLLQNCVSSLKGWVKSFIELIIVAGCLWLRCLHCPGTIEIEGTIRWRSPKTDGPKRRSLCRQVTPIPTEKTVEWLFWSAEWPAVWAQWDGLDPSYNWSIGYKKQHVSRPSKNGHLKPVLNCWGDNTQRDFFFWDVDSVMDEWHSAFKNRLLEA